MTGRLNARPRQALAPHRPRVGGSVTDQLNRHTELTPLPTDPVSVEAMTDQLCRTTLHVRQLQTGFRVALVIGIVLDVRPPAE